MKEVELDLYWIGETDAAYLVRDDRGKNIWLPKSQVDLAEGSEINDICPFLIPEWLAIDKGLI